MHAILPSFYPDFQCRANNCRHSCCKGWEIDIDEEPVEKKTCVISVLCIPAFSKTAATLSSGDSVCPARRPVTFFSPHPWRLRWTTCRKNTLSENFWIFFVSPLRKRTSPSGPWIPGSSASHCSPSCGRQSPSTPIGFRNSVLLRRNLPVNAHWPYRTADIGYSFRSCTPISSIASWNV